MVVMGFQSKHMCKLSCNVRVTLVTSLVVLSVNR
jgi:hypothetical protein